MKIQSYQNKFNFLLFSIFNWIVYIKMLKEITIEICFNQNNHKSCSQNIKVEFTIMIYIREVA